MVTSGLSTPIEDYLSGEASLLHLDAAAALGTPELAALLLPQMRPDLVLVHRGPVTGAWD